MWGLEGISWGGGAKLIAALHYKCAELWSNYKFHPVNLTSGGILRTVQKSAKLANVLYDIRGPIMDAARKMETAGSNKLCKCEKK